jgi:hypothetical protein
MPPNGQARPPADEYGLLKRSDEQHETTFQIGSDTTGWLERSVGRLVAPAERLRL